jgi:hypothetical protein
MAKDGSSKDITGGRQRGDFITDGRSKVAFKRFE